MLSGPSLFSNPLLFGMMYGIIIMVFCVKKEIMKCERMLF